MSRLTSPAQPRQPDASKLVGQFAVATNLAARRSHVVRLTRTAYDDDLAGLVDLPDADRVAAVARIKPARRSLWRARSLCGVRGRQSVYGDVKEYYWRLADPDLSTACVDCLRAWRRLGEPAIAGLDRSASPGDPWPWALPFGWRAVPTAGHPWDVPAGEPVEVVRDKTGAVVGEHRVEVLRWARGPRIVRLVHHVDTDTYAARYWRAGADPDVERWAFRGMLPDAQRECQRLMAQGGY
jgi:hypothetical protein